MQRSRRSRFGRRILFLLLLVSMLHPGTGEAQLLDQIVAVVDKEIILRSEIMAQIAMATMREGQRPTDFSRERVREMFGTVLENMIQEKLLLAKAREESLFVDQEMIEQAVRARVKELKAEHGETEFVRTLRENGVDERDIREQIRQEFRREFLRRQMYNRLVERVDVSELEVNAYRDRHREGLPPLLSISHILIRPEPLADRDTLAMEKARELLRRIHRGADFGELAHQFSDDPGSARDGGSLGTFERGQMVPEFEEAAFSLRPGEISEPVRTAFGYHLIKAEEVFEDRVRARHILIAMQASALDQAAAEKKVLELKTRIEAGEDFATLARELSDHEETALIGGRIPGLYSVEEPPPLFAGAIQDMKLGELSDPVRTDHGWHLLRLNDDREALKEALKQERLQTLFEEVLAETRERLYVDIRPYDLGF